MSQPATHTLLERIQLVLIEETNDSKSLMDFVDKAALRLLELIQDEKKFGR